MTNHPMRTLLPIFCALPILFVPACATYNAQKQTERVAKDWCETIRASQIMPVYPLSEDLKVGDVFLVRMPLSVQEKIFKTKGFLPLDDHRHRLPITNFRSMYFDGYWKDPFGQTPHDSLTLTNRDPITTNTPVELSEARAP